MRELTLPGRILALMLLLCGFNATAGNSVLIWPIDPKIDNQQKATELWVENRGDATTLMQVRVFGWQQVNGQEQYQTQEQVVASPPMVRIEPGKRQMVRLIKQAPPAAGHEAAYRVLLDEIPTPQRPGENQAGLNFQMRYSVPLFVYGQGVEEDTVTPKLSWRLVNREGQQALEITNSGNGHARLSRVSIGGRMVAGSLMGYVLADSTNHFPLTFPVSGQSELSAELDENHTWRSRASTAR